MATAISARAMLVRVSGRRLAGQFAGSHIVGNSCCGRRAASTSPAAVLRSTRFTQSPLQRSLRRLQPSRHSSSTTPPESPAVKYTFDDISARLAGPNSSSPAASDSAPLLLIDVREPSELANTGRIPTARNLPISSFPHGPFLPDDEFAEAFGFEKPSEGAEVVFYCKSGVRSRAAARMVREEWAARGVTVGEYEGSWADWSGRGGEVER